MASKSEILYKQIKLFPTAFTVDVWIGNDYKKLSKIFKKQYGETDEYYLPTPQNKNYVATIYAHKKSKVGEYTSIVMVLEGFSPSIMAHEATHVCWHLSEHSNVELNYSSQEWHACMIEMIMEKCLNKKSYKKL